MNWAQLKDPFCYPCLAGTAVAPCSLKQEVTGSNNLLSFFASLNSVNSMKTLRENLNYHLMLIGITFPHHS